MDEGIEKVINILNKVLLQSCNSLLSQDDSECINHKCKVHGKITIIRIFKKNKMNINFGDRSRWTGSNMDHIRSMIDSMKEKKSTNFINVKYGARMTCKGDKVDNYSRSYSAAREIKYKNRYCVESELNQAVSNKLSSYISFHIGEIKICDISLVMQYASDFNKILDSHGILEMESKAKEKIELLSGAARFEKENRKVLLNLANLKYIYLNNWFNLLVQREEITIYKAHFIKSRALYFEKQIASYVI